MVTSRRAGAVPGASRARPLGLALLLLALTLAEAARAAEPCVPEIARIVSLQGAVQVQRAGTTDWAEASLEQPLCIGDRVRVGPLGRAALAFIDQSVVRLDQRTTLHLRGVDERERNLLDLVLGAVYFFSHRPRALEIGTPFVNAGTEGTEFFVRVGDDFTRIIMFEGRVRAVNPQGELLLAAGEAALARPGEPPRPEIVVRPRDAVAWALYYPPVFAVLAGRDALPEDLPTPLRTAALHAAENRYAQALEVLDEVPPTARDARYWAFRAGLLLNVGRVEEAEDAIGRALEVAPETGDALAQRAIIEIVRNQPEAALASARRAVELSPDSAAARVALSYALQANFELEEAGRVLREAAEAFPEDALVWARLAEIELARGWLDRALEAAERAAALAPGLGRTQMVLGFAHLARIDPGAARAAFERAIELEPANPLSRLGQGLARIRQSELAAGRHEIEIATALDPNHSLIRSYLGKAYFEETREDLAGEQLAIAKELDPNDPTPWFYDAIRKQATNRPVEAMRDLETSIRLNDNRAVYRSRLLLDEDLATRAVSLARIYDDLGFDRRAVVEASRSISLAPSNWSAHRFLSDAYARQPRHEIARASELLQAQLLQPININPVQPSAPITDLNIVSGVGPAEAAFNEFHPLFERNRAQLTATGLVGDAEGNENTFGDEVVLSGVWNAVSVSLGQAHFQTEGFRPNNDLENNIYSAFAQWAVTPTLSLQTEYRIRDSEHGDLELRFEPMDFFETIRQTIDDEILRVGGRLAHPAFGDITITAAHVERSLRLTEELLEIDFAAEQDGTQIEGQHLLSIDDINIVTGAGAYQLNNQLSFDTIRVDREVDHYNIYNYTRIHQPDQLIWTFGISLDDYKEDGLEQRNLNPKFGLEWLATPSILFRAAIFRTLARVRALNQTIEPTTIAGFNQFFDDFSGTEAWQYGIGTDIKLSSSFFVGADVIHRELEGPVFFLGAQDEVFVNQQDEDVVSAYAYWAPTDRLALRIEPRFERFELTASETAPDRSRRVETWLLPVAAGYFSPAGWFGELRTTLVHQDVAGEFGLPVGRDTFVTIDATAGYRFPERRGVASLEIRNMLDQEFAFQDVNFRTNETINPAFIPARVILARLTLTF